MDKKAISTPQPKPHKRSLGGEK